MNFNRDGFRRLGDSSLRLNSEPPETVPDNNSLFSGVVALIAAGFDGEGKVIGTAEG